MSDPTDAPSAPSRTLQEADQTLQEADQTLQEAGRTLQEAGRAIGTYCWVERRLFEVLGGWVEIERDLRAKLLFAEHSLHHGWHSELWTERLPVARGLDAAELVVAPSPEARAVFDALAAMNGPDDTIERLHVLYGVLLPQLVAVYVAAGAVASSVAERPTIRALTLIGRDDADDLIEGRGLLDLMTEGPGATVELGADLAARLAELDARGGLLPAPEQPI